MARVFLSYSSRDRQLAQLVSEELEKLKHTIVVDVDELVVGADSDLVVPLISENATQSPLIISEIGAAPVHHPPPER